MSGETLQVYFLGTAGALPTPVRNPSCIMIRRGSDTLLFDCGEGAQQQMMRSRCGFTVNAVFISHWHADHFAGLIPLIQTMSLEKRKTELKIFGPEAEKFVSNILDLGYFGLRFPVEAINVPFEGSKIEIVDEGKEYQILSVPVLHTIPSVAYCFQERGRWNIDMKKIKEIGLKSGAWLKKLKKSGKAEYGGEEVKLEEVAKTTKGLKVVYSGDTRPCDNLLEISKNVDLLIHDGTFLEEEESKGHANVRQAAKIAKDANVKQLILTHISRRYKDPKELEDEARKIFPNTKVAYDFMKVKLK